MVNKEEIQQDDIAPLPCGMQPLSRSAKRRINREKRKEEKIAAEEKAVMLQQVKDEAFMREALRQAKKAGAIGEVPIGCIIVKDDVILSRGYNRRNADGSTLSHAEITAIRRASKKLGDWRLEECTLYVTLEPCQMCAGAIIQARVPRVVMGAMNPKAGCGGSILNLLEMPEFNHQAKVTRGVLEDACGAMLQDFFKKLRQDNRK